MAELAKTNSIARAGSMQHRYYSHNHDLATEPTKCIRFLFFTPKHRHVLLLHSVVYFKAEC